MSSAERALLFPGQGAQEPAMLARLAGVATFDERAAVVEAALGAGALERIEGGDLEYLGRNRVSSLVTVLASRLALDLYEAEAAAPPAAYAGYSVGQWTALHAAGALGFAELVAVVARRAELMDECVERRPGGMIAVIGLGTGEVEEVVAGLRRRGHAVWIANYNCVGQCSLAGEPAALEAALAELEGRGPKKLARLPVAGGWHSPLVADAAPAFGELLARLELGPLRAPVIDNVTGAFLPEDPAALCAQLARQLHEPIRWEEGIRHLIASGCRELLEVGHGNMLTKFGFFIDRSVRHLAFSSRPAAVGDVAGPGR